jgi:autotransporter passenger strand-loop-strand repeat protein
VNSGGVQFVDGTTIGTVVNSGGTQSAFFGTASGTIVNSGGLLMVDQEAVGTTVNGGGKAVIDFFGSASGITIDGGLVVLKPDASVSDGIVIESGGTLEIDDTVMPTATISGFGPGDTIDLADVAYDSGGSAIPLSGNVLEITENGQSYDLQFDPGQNFAGETFALSFDNVSGTDLRLGTVVSSGTTQYVGGTVSDTTVSGTQVVFGSTTNTTIASGGTQQVVAGGTASGTTVSSGGAQYDAGTVSGTTLSGGTQVVFGSAANTTIASGGTQDVVAGGSAGGTTVSGGGTQYVAGTASGTMLSGGTEVVFGSAVSTTIASGGIQQVVVGGIASGATVSSGGSQYVAGTASNTTVSDGGTEFVFGGDTSATVDSGGTQSVAAGGTANGATVSVGGIQYDAGTASGTVLSGGFQAVNGSAANTTVDGGYELVMSGAIIGGAILSGGTLELQSGATAGSSTIAFSDGGTLKLDATGAYGFLVAGFAVPDEVDLSAVNFASATKQYSGNASSGTLTVSDGTHSASILLLGNYTVASFHLGPESGGGAGTVVTDASVITGASAPLASPPHA